MLLIRLVMVAIWVLAAIAGHEMWSPPVSAVHQAETTAISTPRVENGAETADRYTKSHFDLYGNQIDEALGDYRVDPRGEMYERHSPDTAILKLGPPGV
jgi:hypothetical protein